MSKQWEEPWISSLDEPVENVSTISFMNAGQ